MGEQLGFEGMPRRLYPCTPSRLRTWLDCPRRYRMTYLERPAPPKGPPWAHNSFGASVHNALAGWWRLPVAERAVPAAGRLLGQGWLADGYADSAHSDKHLRRARAMVDRYVATLDPCAEPVGVERGVAMKTELVAVSGRIDRLDDRPRPVDPDDEPADSRRRRDLVVVDYKTGRTPPDVTDVRSSLALALYALAAGRMLRRRCAKVELHHLPTAQVIGWEHTRETLERHLRRTEDLAAECRDADEKFRDEANPRRGDDVFPAQPGALCSWCDYRAHCPEGRMASQARRPWDGLDED
jgi:RecB family exonuclease